MPDEEIEFEKYLKELLRTSKKALGAKNPELKEIVLEFGELIGREIHYKFDKPKLEAERTRLLKELEPLFEALKEYKTKLKEGDTDNEGFLYSTMSKIEKLKALREKTR